MNAFGPCVILKRATVETSRRPEVLTFGHRREVAALPAVEA
jgi:hypothetical protein